MTTGERIRTRRERLGISVQDIADALNVSPATVYRYENGDIEKLPGRVLAPLAAILSTTPAYLMGWCDDPEIMSIPGTQPMPGMRKIPILGTIACGTPILAEQNQDGDADLPDHIHADFALRCKGDSMINARIYDGDVVYIRIQPTVESGEIAAVEIDDEATLKRVHVYDDHIVLSAENPQYRPLAYWGADMERVHILGKAVAYTSIIR